jgi:hypothetical protein
MQKFGENPDIDTGGFETIWDAGGVYVPPTQARIHDVESSDIADGGNVQSEGTATGGSLTTLVDSGATFVSDSVSVGDIVLNDTNVEIATISSVTSETVLTFASSLRCPNDGRISIVGVVSGDAYRVVTNNSTGASVMHILGLNGSFVSTEEFVLLNGIDGTETTKSYVRQHRARVFGPNTTGAVGLITSTALTDDTVSLQINDGNNQTLMSVFTIPVTQNGYLERWWGTLSKKQSAVSNVRLRVGFLSGIGYLQQTRALDNTGSSSFDHRFKPAFIAGGTDIWIEADSNAADVGVSAGFDLTLVDV